jgi:hypothetical protein
MKMNAINDNTYVVVEDKNGHDYLCPSVVGNIRVNDAENRLDECVARDVDERYSANIDIHAVD